MSHSTRSPTHGLSLLVLFSSSSYGFLSVEVPTHAVYEPNVGSNPVVVSNGDVVVSNNPIMWARSNPQKVISPHIDNMTAPSRLTSTPHVSQEELVLRPNKSARSELPNVTVPTFWSGASTTGTATGGIHPVEGDSARANLAANAINTTPSGSRELVPYLEMDEHISNDPLHEDLLWEHSRCEFLYTYWDVVKDIYKECKNYAALASNGKGPPLKYSRRRKKVKKVHPLRSYFHKQHFPCNINNTIRSAREHARAARKRAGTWRALLSMNMFELVVRSLIASASFAAFTTYIIAYWQGIASLVGHPLVIVTSIAIYACAYLMAVPEPVGGRSKAESMPVFSKAGWVPDETVKADVGKGMEAKLDLTTEINVGSVTIKSYCSDGTTAEFEFRGTLKVNCSDGTTELYGTLSNNAPVTPAAPDLYELTDEETVAWKKEQAAEKGLNVIEEAVEKDTASLASPTNDLLVPKESDSNEPAAGSDVALTEPAAVARPAAALTEPAAAVAKPAAALTEPAAAQPAAAVAQLAAALTEPAAALPAAAAAQPGTWLCCTEPESTPPCGGGSSDTHHGLNAPLPILDVRRRLPQTLCTRTDHALPPN